LEKKRMGGRDRKEANSFVEVEKSRKQAKASRKEEAKKLPVRKGRR